jgi:hypothetical protein
MNKNIVIGAGVSAMAFSAAAYALAPAAPPPPIATYWVDVSTQSGLGAGMTPGGRPSMGQIMGMMNGGSSVAHALELRLGSRQKAAGSPDANHLPPAGLQMGPSLPLLTPVVQPTRDVPTGYERPKGRMLIYWGCGEHVGAGQPQVIDFSKLAAGQIPPGMAQLAAMGRAATPPRPGQSASYGEWPNKEDGRAVPAAGSLVGAHQVQGNYSPPIGFTLGAGQDFMPDLGLSEAGTLPSGATRLGWRLAAQATGYALAMYGGTESGDVIVWTSANSAASAANLDFLPPSEVKRLIAAGSALPPTANQCLLPAEVTRASPSGMIMMVGYGPEVHIAEAPKAPKWTTRVRYKTTASLMLGMGDMGDMGGMGGTRDSGSNPQKKRKKRGLGGILPSIPLP